MELIAVEQEEAPLFADCIWWDVYVNGNMIVDILKLGSCTECWREGFRLDEAGFPTFHAQISLYRGQTVF